MVYAKQPLLILCYGLLRVDDQRMYHRVIEYGQKS